MSIMCVPLCRSVSIRPIKIESQNFTVDGICEFAHCRSYSRGPSILKYDLVIQRRRNFHSSGDAKNGSYVKCRIYEEITSHICCILLIRGVRLPGETNAKLRIVSAPPLSFFASLYQYRFDCPSIARTQCVRFFSTLLSTLLSKIDISI